MWKAYSLDDDDAKAKRTFLENVDCVAYTQTILRKLMPRLSSATGPMLLIAQELLDLDRIEEFRWSGTYAGRLLNDALGSSPFPIVEHSEAGVAKLVGEYLTGSSDNIVIVGELSHCRSDLLHWRTAGMRFGFFGDEAYPILSHCDTADLEVMTDAIRSGQWSTGLFSKSSTLSAASSDDIELTEPCLDEIVTNTVHLFTAALDGEGYLIWSIGKERDQTLISDFLKPEDRANRS